MTWEQSHASNGVWECIYTTDRPHYHALRGTTLHNLHYQPHPAQLEEKYGKRTVDRLKEMVEKVVFENESYRR